MKLNWKRIFLSGIVIWIVGTVYMFLTCGWLFSWIYEIPPKIWNSPESMLSAKTMIASNVIGIIVAVIFAAVFAVLYKGIPGKGVKKGMVYGLIVWLVGAVSGLASLPLYMTIAPAVVIYWILQALVGNLVYGAIVGRLYKER